jgi:hypothetical protein
MVSKSKCLPKNERKSLFLLFVWQLLNQLLSRSKKRVKWSWNTYISSSFEKISPCKSGFQPDITGFCRPYLSQMTAPETLSFSLISHGSFSSMIMYPTKWRLHSALHSARSASKDSTNCGSKM